MKFISNIFDTALIFEGGGMRASYTAGFVNTLLENQLHFDYVAGISAGSSHCVNYLSRDTQRARHSFVEFVLDPNIGGWKSFLRGKGYFRSHYIYYKTSHPEGTLPLNFAAFMANPARFRIGAFEQDSGRMRYFSREDVRTLEDLNRIVCSSSSVPFLMPPNYHNDHYFLDGGLNGGIALDIAKKDGFKKFFVFLTRERGFRKGPIKFRGAIKAYYRKYPQVADAITQRHKAYNQTMEELKQLESEGKAMLVFPDVMPVSNTELDYRKLSHSYELGYDQGKRDLPRWREFLQIES